MANPDLRSTGGLQMRRDCSLNSLGHRYRSEHDPTSSAIQYRFRSRTHPSNRRPFPYPIASGPLALGRRNVVQRGAAISGTMLTYMQVYVHISLFPGRCIHDPSPLRWPGCAAEADIDTCTTSSRQYWFSWRCTTPYWAEEMVSISSGCASW
jgi:hypothetical protein